MLSTNNKIKDPHIDRIELRDKQVFVISDLHLARGLSKNKSYGGNENFFYDDSFSRWLNNHCQAIANDTGGVLIINGDFIDFLRIIFFKGEWEALDLEHWRKLLEKVDIIKSAEDLKMSMNEKEEKRFGFKTDDFKTIWKLEKVFAGHPDFFAALAKWLSNKKNQLIIIKGNHDMEWHWQKVQQYFKVFLAEMVAAQHNAVLEDSAISFYEESLIINNTFYIEHGHRHEAMTSIDGKAELEGKKAGQLRLPLGSLINRYIINRIELDYPYIDNIKPAQNILPLLIRERFPLAIQLIFKRLWYMMKFLEKGQFGYVFGNLLFAILIIGLPILFVSMLMIDELKQLNLANDTSYLAIFKPVKNVAFLILSYYIGRVLVLFRLKESNNLYDFAKEIFNKHPEITYVTMGHTHRPFQIFENNKLFCNTGTWIPILETSTAHISTTCTFTFLNFMIDAGGEIVPKRLARWNDDANREEEMKIVERNKDSTIRGI